MDVCSGLPTNAFSMLVRRWQNIKFTILLRQVTFLYINYFIFVSFCHIFMSKQFLLCQCDFLLYQAISYMHQMNHCSIHEVVNIFMSSCMHIFIHQERGDELLIRRYHQGEESGDELSGLFHSHYSRVLWKNAFIDPAV